MRGGITPVEDANHLDTAILRGPERAAFIRLSYTLPPWKLWLPYSAKSVPGVAISQTREWTRGEQAIMQKASHSTTSPLSPLHV